MSMRSIFSFGGGIVGAIVGSLIPGVGTAIGFAAGSIIGGAIGMLAFPTPSTTTYGPRQQTRDMQITSFGSPIPLPSYGLGKYPLILTECSELREVQVEHTQEQGGSNQPSSSYIEYNYYLDFGGQFCEGLPSWMGRLRLFRIWLDDKLVYNKGQKIGNYETPVSPWMNIGEWPQIASSPTLNFQFHPGTWTQKPWTILETTWAAGHMPAYKGLCGLAIGGLNVTPYANRVPNVRALIGPGTPYTLGAIIPVEGYPGNGSNRGSRFFSLQTIMSVDESYIVVCEPDWDNNGWWWYKINTINHQLISSDFIPGSIPGTEIDALCENHYAGYADPYGWHHPASLDELGRVYAIGCDGLGRFYRLNSDTWVVEAYSPVWCNDHAQKTADLGDNADDWMWTTTRVSTNPANPWLWAICQNSQLGTSPYQAVALIDRETMANPFDAAHWAYLFFGPEGLTPLDFDKWVACAMAINQTDGSCFVLWENNTDQQLYLSRLYPDGSRTDVEITTDADIIEAVQTYSWHRQHMGYDPVSDQVFFFGVDLSDLAGYTYFFNGDDLSFAGRVEMPEGITYADDSYGEDNFQRGVVDGYFYCGTATEDQARIYKLYVPDREWDEDPIFELTEDETDDFWALNGPVYCKTRDSVYLEVIYNAYNDSILREILLDRLEPNTVILWQVVRDICERAGLGTDDINTAELTDLVKGYQALDEKTARAALEPLMAGYLFDGAEFDGKLNFVKRGNAPAGTIDVSEMAAHSFGEERPTPLVQQILQETSELPKQVNVGYYDRKWKLEYNEQFYQRQVTNSRAQTTIQLPLVFTKDEAMQLAHILCKQVWVARKTFEFSVGPEHSNYTPSDVVTITDGASTHQVLITEKREEGLLTHFKGVADQQTIYNSTMEGEEHEIEEEDIAYPGPAIGYVLDLPCLRTEHNGPGVYLAAGAYFAAWEGCSVYISKDLGESWQVLEKITTRTPTGVVLTAPGDFSENVWDKTNTIRVRLDYSADTLSSISKAEMLAGFNAAVIGNFNDPNNFYYEIIQFQDVVDEGSSEFTLSTLLRGRKGTEWATGLHAASEKFILLRSTSLVWKGLDNTYLNQDYLYRFASSGMSWESTIIRQFGTDLLTLKPWSVSHVEGSRDGANNLTITWVRRARINNEWVDLVDVPLGEGSEEYEVDILDPDSSGIVLRTITVSSESASYSAAEQTADGITPGDPVDCIIYQMSETVGRGYGAEATV